MRKTVYVGMSGGVDSSVSALLLKERGYEVIGATLELFKSGNCCDKNTYMDAKNICKKLGIPHFIFDYQNVLLELYKYQIFQNSMQEYRIPILAPKTYVELQEELDEKSHRMRLFSAIKQLESSYRKLQDEDVIAKIEKEIKL